MCPLGTRPGTVCGKPMGNPFGKARKGNWLSCVALVVPLGCGTTGIVGLWECGIVGVWDCGIEGGRLDYLPTVLKRTR